VLPEKFESPAYNAVTAVVPNLGVKIVKLVEPSLRDPVPSTAEPFTNVTISPSGGLPALEVTTAENVTACP
jgi:hypothetical protein